MRSIMLLIVMVAGLTLLGNHTAWSMSSTNYSMEWIVPLTGGGNTTEPTSTNYKAEITYGQTARGPTSGTNTTAEFGYWYGVLQLEKVFPWALFLPAVIGHTGH